MHWQPGPLENTAILPGQITCFSPWRYPAACGSTCNLRGAATTAGSPSGLVLGSADSQWIENRTVSSTARRCKELMLNLFKGVSINLYIKHERFSITVSRFSRRIHLTGYSTDRNQFVALWGSSEKLRRRLSVTPSEFVRVQDLVPLSHSDTTLNDIKCSVQCSSVAYIWANKWQDILEKCRIIQDVLGWDSPRAFAFATYMGHTQVPLNVPSADLKDHAEEVVIISWRNGWCTKKIKKGRLVEAYGRASHKQIKRRVCLSLASPAAATSCIPAVKRWQAGQNFAPSAAAVQHRSCWPPPGQPKWHTPRRCCFSILCHISGHRMSSGGQNELLQHKNT